eukprot:m51a1_g10803 hypothetical protein (309) ;mRNA; r:30398-31324
MSVQRNLRFEGERHRLAFLYRALHGLDVPRAPSDSVRAHGIQLASDLHIDAWPADPDGSVPFPITPRARYLAVAGDISPVCSERLLGLFGSFLARASAAFERVFVVAGNHEYYGATLQNADDAIDRTCSGLPNVTRLRRGMRAFDVDERTRVVGATLWTRVPAEHASSVQRGANVYRRAFRAPGEPLAVEDTNAEYDASMSWIRQEARRARDDGRSLVVVTHYSPIWGVAGPACVRDERLRCCFESRELEADLCSERAVDWSAVRAWMFGHTHECGEWRRGGIVFVANQCGYWRKEWPDYDDSLYVTL